MTKKQIETDEIPSWFPDWKDSGSYNLPSLSNLPLWAWEFLRRNLDYQRDWQEHYVQGELRWVSENLKIESREERSKHQNLNARKFNVMICAEAAKRGEIVYVERGRPFIGTKRTLQIFLCEKYSIRSHHLCDPAVDNPSRELLSFETQFSPPITMRHMQSRNNTKGMLPSSPSEVITKIDLNWPIEMQFKRLKQALKPVKEQLLKEGKLNPKDPRVKGETVKMYEKYVRILDAKTLGRSNAEIAKVIYPDKENNHPEYYGSGAVQDSFDAAKLLRDTDYRYLCIRL